METNTCNRNIAGLAFERCDELEEMALHMAREMSHLKSMLLLVVQETNTGASNLHCKHKGENDKHDSSTRTQGNGSRNISRR